MWCAARHCAFESHPLRQYPDNGSYPGFSFIRIAFWQRRLYTIIQYGRYKSNVSERWNLEEYT